MKALALFCAVFLPILAWAIPFQNGRIERMLSSTPTNSPLHRAFEKRKSTCVSAESGLAKISAPQNRHGDNRPFEYYYEKRFGADPNQPVIIVLPGGPGDFSIGMGDVGFKNLTAIYFDARGTGCNFGNQDDFLWSDVSTDEATSDIFDVIKTENLTNFIIYGISYGTVLATRLAVKLEAAGLPPMAVVLDGTIGRSYGDGINVTRGFVDTGNIFLAENPALAARFADTNMPLGFNASFWAFWIAHASQNWQASVITLQTLQNPQAPGYQSVVDDLIQDNLAFGKTRPSYQSELPGYFVLQSVMCSELSPSFFVDDHLATGPTCG